MADEGNSGKGPVLKWALLIGVFFALLALSQIMLHQEPARPKSYSEFKQLVADGQVESVTFEGSKVSGLLRNGATAQPFTSFLPPTGDPDLLASLERQGVEVRSQPADDGSSWLVSLLPWLLIFGFWYFLWFRMSGSMMGGMGRGGVGDILRGKTEPVKKAAIPKVRLSDVAGQENAKAEVGELLEFLRDAERYQRLGAEVPHGILLQGPPGTGKTLIARALAGEAGVPFFHMSASEFIEMFVGVGASRVRNLFDAAKKAQPSIIFIDELDSVGRVRGAGLGGGHDEREQTLNQILAEMDGFEGHEAVVVLAATNRPDVLDPALLRPGRFDRHVTLELPDLAGREAILKVHCRSVPLAGDVDLHKVATGTPGFSGADLKNLVNEAAMAAARENLTKVEARHFDQMRDRIMMGAVRTLAIHEDERHRLAVHESGHTAVAYFLPEADPLHKVTIIPRGRSLGSTHQLPEIERHTLPESYLQDRLAVILGGRAAEQVFLGSVSSGADEDIRMATQIARSMVGRWGMSEEVGPVDVRESESHPFLGREMAQPRSFSEATAALADKAVKHYLVDAEARAVEVLKQNEAKVGRLIAELEERETLDRNEIAVCLGPKEVAAGAKKKASKPEAESGKESG
ncbi:ATP-dependent zinc metalloprotease FtsH [Nisaea acidiphila]|uniref:ATP-dependent zinc metalloprotease FtsH n=1 Tax=Nisaea acidiphila TaxID=1862145 RepID=A0A9J7APZ8_9PROT|nr:ATP-dependent zinc metalloprotease FtsH [Nisaea acidiphila]UUX49683.1 ATP-dependent zinc metalloprotease FtsH [Nisaea acidiphila]